jgi:hypothetical protein
MEVSGHLHDVAALPWGKRPQYTHWITLLVGPRADTDAVEKRRISESGRNRTHISGLLIP